MCADILLPTSSEYDKGETSEGALDPLGMYAIADSLATRLIPGIRERMSHPRYLTAMAVGAFLTREFEERVAADGQSEAWMVYEWYVVEGLVRSYGNDPRLKGLPGVDKSKDAISKDIWLSASSYLKTAGVFGFHGVYRPLAWELDVVRRGQLGETGYNLITTWEAEQGLAGFVTGTGGAGESLRSRLRDAIKDGLEKGRVARGQQWSGWGDIGRHLFPNEIPAGETKVISAALKEAAAVGRGQVIDYLTSPKGQALWNASKSEVEFHQALQGNVTPDVGHLLSAITAYERFARLLQDAFNDCLYVMSKTGARVKPSTLAKEKTVIRCAEEIQKLYYEVSNLLGRYGESVRFTENFSALTEPASPEAWASALLDHHARIQRKKPPRGKSPWFERFDDGGAVIRPLYRRDNPASKDGSYVHSYRTVPLWSFLTDLNLAASDLKKD